MIYQSSYCYSGNYGAHAIKIHVGNLSIWYSYQTPIAFSASGYGFVARRNDWSTTTGKHFSALPGGHDRKTRLDGATFEAMLNEATLKNFLDMARYIASERLKGRKAA